MLGKKIIIMPDSFKGSITSKDAAGIIAAEAKKYGWNTEEMSIADGGEGSLDCILAISGGKREYLSVVGPDGNPKEAEYGVTPDGTAIIEISQSTGITRQESLNPLTSNTFGFGQMILDALDKGTRNFLLCLGGSASTDSGLGMAQALGVMFYDTNGRSFIPSGESLLSVSRIDISGLDKRVSKSTFKVLSDVENDLYGPNGAAYVFAPQKGASPNQVELLDKGLKHVASLVEGVTGLSPGQIRGAGSAGGAGYGCSAFLKAKVLSGIDTILDLYQFKEKLQGCGLIATGEGKLDSQSFNGKVLSGIREKSGQIPIVAFCGTVELDDDFLKEKNITAIEIGKGTSKEESIKNGAFYLQQAAYQYFKETEV